MSSQVSIVNGALVHLGQELIVSLDDDTKPARTMKARFDAVRDDLLFRHPWRFALSRTSIAADSTSPEFNWSYKYDFPIDCIRGYRIKDPDEPWIREGSKILTDHSGPLNLQYIRRVSDPNRFDPSFTELMSLELAIRTCMQLTQDRFLLQQILFPLREEALNSARSASSMEGYPEEFVSESGWVEIRY